MTNDDNKTPESDNEKTATEKEQKIDNITTENGNTNESSDSEKQTLSENNKDNTPNIESNE